MYKKALLAPVLLLFVIYAGYYNFYLPKEENLFVRKIESEFNTQKSSIIEVMSITDFEWDAVCFFGDYFSGLFLVGHVSPIVKDSIPKDLFRYTKSYYEAIRDEAPKFGRPDFKGAHFFIRDNNVAKEYIYHSNGFRIRGDKLLAFHVLDIGGDIYSLLNHHGFEKEPCIEKENAVFKITEDNLGYKKVLLSSKKEEN